MLDTVHRNAARAVMRLWPFPFAHVRLMKFLRPPPPTEDALVCRLRGYPLRLKCDPRTYIGRRLYFRGMYEEPLVATMARLLTPGMTFLDVGANIGLHCVVAAHRVGPTGRVLACEPQQQTAGQLRENLALNGLTNVTVVQAALGEVEESRTLFQVSATNSGQATLALSATEEAKAVETVSVTTLATAAQAAGVERFDGVKIDVEGAELAVLRGSRSFLERHWPAFILVECIDPHLRRFGTSSRELIDFLEAHGYTVRLLRGGSWRPLGSKDGVSADLLATRAPS